MLKVKKGVKLEILENYGFKLEPTRTCYLKRINDEMNIFVWVSKEKGYMKRCLYIEPRQYSMILSELDVIYDLIKDNILEKGSDKE